MFQATRIAHPDAATTGWHCHATGQLSVVFAGALTVEYGAGRRLLPPGHVVWIPAGLPHSPREHGPIDAITLQLDGSRGPLPHEVLAFRCDGLITAVLRRCTTFGAVPGDAQLRLIDVLYDELSQAVDCGWVLPLPQERRIARIAQGLLASPADGRSREAWGRVAGLSGRSVSRLFVAETGMGFAEWRTLLRVLHSFELLAGGESVGTVAEACGYESVSAFIAAFRETTGETPGKLFAVGA